MKPIAMRLVFWLFALMLLLPIATEAQPQDRRPEPVKTGTWRGDEIDYKSQEIRVKLEPSARRDQSETLFSADNGTITDEFNEIGWILVEVPSGKSIFPTIEALQRSPLVITAEPNTVGRIHVRPDDPYFQGGSPASYARQWALENTGQSPPGGTGDADIDAELAWNHTTGSSNTVVAVLDSGIPMQQDGDGDWDKDDLSHSDLDDPNKIILGLDYSNDGNGVKDEVGHGTHVAGIAGAETNNGKGIAGICWDCKLLITQVADINGNVDQADFYSGVKHAVDYAANNALNLVINASLGWNNPSTYLEDGINYAKNNGASVIVSAGNARFAEGENDGTDCGVHYPAAYSTSYSNVIAVASSNHNDNWSNFSCTGSELNVAAPGGHGGTWDQDDIYSTTPNYPFTLQNNYPITQNYGYQPGTSMASPHVAGTAALVLSEDPSKSPSEVRNILEHTAEDVNGGGTDNQLGHGRINAYKAVEQVTPPPAPSNFHIANSSCTGCYVRLKWDGAISATSYEIYRDKGSGFQKIATTTGGSYWDYDTRIGDDWSGTVVAYYAKAVNQYGTSGASSYDFTPEQKSLARETSEEAALPDTTVLEAPAPNPVREQATIRYGLSEATDMRLSVYDVMGRRVATLARGWVPAGYHEATLQGPDLPSGVYLYRLEAGSFTQTKRLTVVR